MRKTFLSILLVAALMLTTMGGLIGAVSAAEGDVSYAVSVAKWAPGSTVPAGTQFVVEVSASAMDVQAAQVKLSYDPATLKAVSGESAGWLSKMFQGGNVNVAPAKQDNADQGEVWITGMSLTNQTGTDGEVIATVIFETLVDVTADEVVSIYYAKTGRDAGGEEPEWVETEATALTDGGLVFEEYTRVPGDVNLDGRVNNRDAILLGQYLMQMAPLSGEQLDNADVQGRASAVVNNRDLIMLKQFNVGMDVVLE